MISHVAIADLDGDDLRDVIVCDAYRNIVAWVRQSPRGTFTEQTRCIHSSALASCTFSSRPSTRTSTATVASVACS